MKRFLIVVGFLLVPLASQAAIVYDATTHVQNFGSNVVSVSHTVTSTANTVGVCSIWLVGNTGGMTNVTTTWAGVNMTVVTSSNKETDGGNKDFLILEYI